jgi:hypothetical protein
MQKSAMAKWPYSVVMETCGSPIWNRIRYAFSNAFPKSPYRMPRPSEPSGLAESAFLQGRAGRVGDWEDGLTEASAQGV